MAQRTVDKPTFKDFYTLLDHPRVNVVIGKKRSGKTALACRIAHDFHEHGITPIFMPQSRDVEKHLPDFVKIVNPNNIRWINNSIYILDDIHLKFHARRYYTKEALILDRIMSISGHKDISFVITTQYGARADINIFRDADNKLIKKPNFNAIKFDRSQLKDLLEEAYFEFSRLPKGVDPRKYVYVQLDSDISAMIGDYNLPKWWNQQISRHMRKA